jgi:cell volume regulation protein A
MVVADDGLGLITFERADLAQQFAVLALVVILFEGGLASSWTAVRPVWRPAVALASVGTVVTMAVVATAFRLAFDTSWNVALLTGAVISSTDAAAVFSVVGRAGLSPRLLETLRVESGVNDPMAVLLTIGLIESMSDGLSAGGWVAFGLRQFAVGAVVGLAVGRLAAVALRRVTRHNASHAVLLALAAAGLAYSVAATFGGSGFLAVYLAGLGVGSERAFQAPVEQFHSAVAEAAQIGLFLLLGVLVFPSQLPPVIVPALVVTAVLLFVARPLAVALCLAPFGFRPGELVIASWAGLRGAVPIVLATFALTTDLPEGNLIFDVTFFVVLLSATAQGLTIPWLARRLGPPPDPDTSATAERRSAGDQLWHQHRVGWPVPGDRLEEHLHGTKADGGEGLADGRQERFGIVALGTVEPDHGDVDRSPFAGLVQGPHHATRHQIVGDDESVDVRGQERRDGMPAGVPGEITVGDEAFVGLQAGGREPVQVAGQAIGGIGSIERTGDGPDPSTPLLDEMGDRLRRGCP